MLRFLARRTLFIIMVCVLIIFFVHLGMRMAVNSTGAGVSLDLARDTSLAWTDTVAYIRTALQGQLGFVISEHGFPVLIRDILRESYINSMGLLLFALTGAALIGVPTGGFLSLTRHKVLVLPILTLTLIGISLPSFFVGISYSKGRFSTLRTFGHRLVSIIGFAWDFEHMLLPVLVLSARPLAYLSRASYISLSRIIEQDFIRTAYAKGLSRMRTVNVHAFKNMAVPVLTAIGVSLRFSLGSLPVVELLFHWPGIGLNLLQAINAHQTALVATLALALGVTFLLFNLILDVAFRIIDPRPRGSEVKRVKDLFSKILNPRPDLSELPRLLSEEAYVAERAERRKKSLLKAVFTNVPLLLGTIIVFALFLVVLFGPALAPQNPYLTSRPITPHFDRELDQFIQPPLPPSEEFPLGTDRWGIDLLSLLMHGARNTLVACAFITMARVFLGLALGGLAGWNEGRAADQIVMGIIGVITSLPLLISSLILIYALDIRRGLPVFIIALSIVGWTEIAQYTRSEFLVLKKMPYIEGAEAAGLPALAKAVRHVLPNVLPQLLVITFLEMGAVMMLLGELGFIGVYIGGGTRISIEVAVEVNQIFHLVEIPEWGAMLAEGFIYLRSKPFVVFPPALAFFIAVLGFNTLGEGLRRHIEVYGLNTAVLLRKRMLLIVFALVMATGYIIQRTGPAPWFNKVAMAFNGERAYQEAQTLTEMSGRGHGQDGGAEAVDYIAEQFESFGLDPGRRHNSYIYSIESQLVRPIQQPELALLNPDGSEAVKFIHQEDFGFVIAGHGGGGQVEAPLTFIGFRGNSKPSPQAYKGLDLQGKIVLLQEGNAPEDFPTEALIRGAQGILWIKQESGDTLRSEMIYIEEDRDFMRSPTLPIFQVGPAVAQIILSNDGLTIPDLFQIEAADAVGDGWFRRDLAPQIRMQLELTEPQDYQVQNVIGYRPGSDFDHAGELLVLFANYDGLGIDPDGTVYPAANHNSSGVAMLLEIAHLWQEQSLDPRRPVLFVAWGTGTQRFVGVDEFLSNNANFRYLASMNPTHVFCLESYSISIMSAAGEAVLQVTGNAPGRYLDVLRETVAELEVDLVAPESFAQSFRIGSGTDPPWMHLGWVNADIAPQDDVTERLDVERFQDFGEVFALMMAKIVRQTNY